MSRTINTHSITFYRRSQPTLINGEVVPGSPTSLGPVNGSLQPLVQGARFGEVVKVLPSGLESTSIKLFYSNNMTLRGVNKYEGHDSDYCILSDGLYEVFQTAAYESRQGTQHTVYILVRRPDKTGEIPR